MRPQHEIIEELVAGVRGLDSRFREFEGSIGERISRPGRRFRRFHPMMLEDMSHMISDEGDDPLALLMIASFAREDFPWLYELVSELYREIRIGDAKAIQRAGQRLRRATKMLRRGPFLDLMMDGSKESHFMAMELPHMLERFIHRYDGAKIEGLPEESDNDQKGEG